MPRSRTKSKYETAMDKMETDFEKQGAIFFQPGVGLSTESISPLPENMSDVVSHELGQLLNEYTQRKAYMRTLFGWQLTKVEIAQLEYETLTNPIYLSLNSKMTEKLKDRMVLEHVDVLAAYENLKKAKHGLKLLELQISNFEDIIFLISREITRREKDIGDQDRVHNNENRRSRRRV